MGKGSSGGAGSDADEYRNIGACSLVFIAFFWVSGGICKFTLEPTGNRYHFFFPSRVWCVRTRLACTEALGYRSNVISNQPWHVHPCSDSFQLASATLNDRNFPLFPLDRVFLAPITDVLLSFSAAPVSFVATACWNRWP